MSAANLQTQAKAATVATFITALVTNVVVFSAEIAIFTLLRPRFKVIYSPRTFIPVVGKRAETMSNNVLKWPLEVYNLDYDDIRRQNGLDAYVFVRFLRMMCYMLVPIWLISWAVLLPINAIRSPLGQTGLNRFTFGNIKPDDYPRFSAHLILAYLFTFWIFWVVKREMRHFITIRQRHLIDPAHAKSSQASTMLVTGVPPRYLHPAPLKALFGIMPGGVKRVWINRDLKDIPDLWEERLAVINKLEGAETSLMNTAASLEQKRQKAIVKGKEPKPINTSERRENVDPEQPLSLAEQLVPVKERPTHRLKAISFLPFGLPFTGKKVDTIDWCREEIVRLNKEVGERQRRCQDELAMENSPSGEEEMYPRMNSAFVQFNHQLGAHLAQQSLAHHEPYRMGNKYTDVAPEDIVWSNLNLNPYEAKVRLAISYAATAGLVILWAIPVAFVGAVSNIHSLCEKFKWLHWVCTLPPVVVGILSGLLPPVLLAVLMMLLPIVLRLLAQFEGIPTRTGIELSLMSRFFLFQVVHSFLIVSLSAGIINSLASILNNLSATPNLLATNLPGASIFFLTYILLQLSGVAGGFLQIVPLIVYYVKLFLLGSTPRSVYAIKNTMRSVQWGTLFPNITLIMVVTLAYSVLQPIINGLAMAIFFLLYQLWKYLFLYQLNQPSYTDTGGLFFPKAITQIFVGLYVEQICLMALFFLQQDSKKHPSCIPEGILMIVLVVITAGFHMILNDSYGPLLKSLPLSLVDYANQDDVNNSSEELGAGAPVDEEKKVGGGAASTGVDVASSGNVPTSTRRNGKRQGSLPPLSGQIPFSDAKFEEPEISPTDAVPKPSDVSSSDNGQSQPGGKGEPEERYGGLRDFTHPALQPARIVWIPLDTLGVGEEEARDIRSRGIDVATRGAYMNEKGTVDVDTYPPGEKPLEGPAVAP